MKIALQLYKNQNNPIKTRHTGKNTFRLAGTTDITAPDDARSIQWGRES